MLFYRISTVLCSLLLAFSLITTPSYAANPQEFDIFKDYSKTFTFWTSSIQGQLQGRITKEPHSLFTSTSLPSVKKALFASTTRNPFKSFYPAYYTASSQAVFKRCTFITYPFDLDHNPRTQEWWVAMSTTTCLPHLVVSLTGDPLQDFAHNWILQRNTQQHYQVVMEFDRDIIINHPSLTRPHDTFMPLTTQHYMASFAPAKSPNTCGEFNLTWRYQPTTHTYQLQNILTRMNPLEICPFQYDYHKDMFDTIDPPLNSRNYQAGLKVTRAQGQAWAKRLANILSRYPLVKSQAKPSPRRKTH